MFVQVCFHAAQKSLIQPEESLHYISHDVAHGCFVSMSSNLSYHLVSITSLKTFILISVALKVF